MNRKKINRNWNVILRAVDKEVGIWAKLIPGYVGCLKQSTKIQVLRNGS